MYSLQSKLNQSVEEFYIGGVRGYDGGKKVKGRQQKKRAD